MNESIRHATDRQFNSVSAGCKRISDVVFIVDKVMETLMILHHFTKQAHSTTAAVTSLGNKPPELEEREK